MHSLYCLQFIHFLSSSLLIHHKESSKYKWFDIITYSHKKGSSNNAAAVARLSGSGMKQRFMKDLALGDNSLGISG